MISSTTVKARIGWLLEPSYLAALAGISLCTVTLVWAATPPEAERAEKERLCQTAVQELINATDSVSVERSVFLIEELRCNVVEASLAK